MSAMRRRDPVTPELAAEVLAADSGCVGPRIGMPGTCYGRITLDHIRASGGLSLRSPSVRGNLASLCLFTHHPLKTERARTWRPLLLDYVRQRDRVAA